MASSVLASNALKPSVLGRLHLCDKEGKVLVDKFTKFHGKDITLGSDAQCQIRLKSGPVLPLHARVQLDSNGHVILKFLGDESDIEKDPNYAVVVNGVRHLVNGEPKRLSHCDRFKIGNATFSYEKEGGAESPSFKKPASRSPKPQISPAPLTDTLSLPSTTSLTPTVTVTSAAVENTPQIAQKEAVMPVHQPMPTTPTHADTFEVTQSAADAPMAVEEKAAETTPTKEFSVPLSPVRSDASPSPYKAPIHADATATSTPTMRDARDYSDVVEPESPLHSPVKTRQPTDSETPQRSNGAEERERDANRSKKRQSKESEQSSACESEEEEEEEEEVSSESLVDEEFVARVAAIDGSAEHRHSIFYKNFVPSSETRQRKPNRLFVRDTTGVKRARDEQPDDRSAERPKKRARKEGSRRRSAQQTPKSARTERATSRSPSDTEASGKKAKVERITIGSAVFHRLSAAEKERLRAQWERSYKAQQQAAKSAEMKALMDFNYRLLPTGARRKSAATH